MLLTTQQHNFVQPFLCFALQGQPARTSTRLCSAGTSTAVAAPGARSARTFTRTRATPSFRTCARHRSFRWTTPCRSTVRATVLARCSPSNRARVCARGGDVASGGCPGLCLTTRRALNHLVGSLPNIEACTWAYLAQASRTGSAATRCAATPSRRGTGPVNHTANIARCQNGANNRDLRCVCAQAQAPKVLGETSRNRIKKLKRESHFMHA